MTEKLVSALQGKPHGSADHSMRHTRYRAEEDLPRQLLNQGTRVAMDRYSTHTRLGLVDRKREETESIRCGRDWVLGPRFSSTAGTAVPES